MFRLTKKRTLETCDNGSGASQSKIQEALKSVGTTLKRSEEREQFGQFGYGNFASLPIAEQLTITSCPQTRIESYTRYVFVTDTIRQQKQVVIEGETVDNLTFDPEGKTWWRTSFLATGVTKDTRKSNVSLETLSSSIAFHYGDVIRKRNIKITLTLIDGSGKSSSVNVDAPEFSGNPLDIYTATRSDCGKVEITFFISRLERGGRKGTVAFRRHSNPSRISGQQFVASASGMLDEAVAKAITGGVIEGVVVCEKINLDANRKQLKEDDSLLALCDVLETWFEKVGRKILEETETQDSDHRFQKIGTQVMPFAELLLQQEQFQHVASKITIGSIGSGHAKVPKKKILGQDDGTSLAVGGNPFVEKPSGGESEGEKGGKPSKEIPEHHPGVVYGIKGKRRTQVRGGSTGLRFDYIEMEDFRTPFMFDPDTGTLAFNIRHPSWGRCQEKDAYLREYHKAVLTTALTLETFRNGNGEQAGPELFRFAHESLNHQTFTILNGDAMMGVEQPKKKKK